MSNPVNEAPAQMDGSEVAEALLKPGRAPKPQTLPTVVQALSAVMGDVQAVGKDSRNQAQGFNFRGIDAVVNAVGPALRKHGVVMSCEDASLPERSQTTSAKGAIMHWIHVHLRYTFHGPAGDTISTCAHGEVADSGDKAYTKAQSVALRTALLQSLCVPTDEPDPDEETHFRTESPGPAPKATKHPAAEKARQAAAPQAQPASVDVDIAELRKDAWGLAMKLLCVPDRYTAEGLPIYNDEDCKAHVARWIKEAHLPRYLHGMPLRQDGTPTFQGATAAQLAQLRAHLVEALKLQGADIPF